MPSDTIAIRNGKFARLNDRPIFFFTETRTIVFDFPQGYTYSDDDEYELSLDVDTDVTTGPMLRVNGSVDTENRTVTFVLPFYGDAVKERINGRDSSVMLVMQLVRASNTTGVRHVLLHDTVLCIPAVDDGGDGSDVLPDAEQQPANAHYTVQELDEYIEQYRNTQKWVILDENDSQNPDIPDGVNPTLVDYAPAPLIRVSPPTTETAGFLMQGCLDTTTQKTYTCTKIVVDGTSRTYIWSDDVNTRGGTFSAQGDSLFNVTVDRGLSIGLLNTADNGGLAVGAYSHISKRGASVGTNITISAEYSLAVGRNLKVDNSCQLFTGKYGVTKNAARLTGGGTDENSRKNIEELDWKGNHYVAGGCQQGITEIPAATSLYTLAEGGFSHAPTSAPTYVLPAVTDATRSHEIVLDVKFSQDVLTYAFEDADGNAIAPVSYPEMTDGIILSFLCRYVPMMGTWVVMPLPLGVVPSEAEGD